MNPIQAARQAMKTKLEILADLLEMPEDEIRDAARAIKEAADKAEEDRKKQGREKCVCGFCDGTDCCP